MNRGIETLNLIRGNAQAGRIVPPSGISAWVVIVTGAAMTFLAALAMLIVSIGARTADGWSDSLALSVTVELGLGATEEQRTALQRVLETSPGIKNVREVDKDAQKALLEPVVGAALDDFALPVLFTVDFGTETDASTQIENLRLRLEAELPDAVLDDQGSWRRPMVVAAASVAAIGRTILAAVLVALVSVVVLAAEAAIAANRRNIRTLRLIGANDGFIVRAFVRRITLRSLGGAVLGLGAAIIAFLVLGGSAGGLWPSPSPVGWIFTFAMVPLVGLVAFVATRIAAFRSLKRIH